MRRRRTSDGRQPAGIAGKAQARQEGGIPPTTYRAANCRKARRQGRERVTRRRMRPCAARTARRHIAARRRIPEVTKRGHDRGRQRSGPISEGGDLRRTAPRRRTCVRQEGARTRKSPLMEREHRCPERDRIFYQSLTTHHVERLGAFDERGLSNQKRSVNSSPACRKVCDKRRFSRRARRACRARR